MDRQPEEVLIHAKDTHENPNVPLAMLLDYLRLDKESGKLILRSKVVMDYSLPEMLKDGELYVEGEDADATNDKESTLEECKESLGEIGRRRPSHGSYGTIAENIEIMLRFAHANHDEMRAWAEEEGLLPDKSLRYWNSKKSRGQSVINQDDGIEPDELAREWGYPNWMALQEATE